MKERPIPFNSEMIRAILAGKKTMTRRVIKPQPPEGSICGGVNVHGQHIFYFDDETTEDDGLRKCPYGKAGDKLWVKESWYFMGTCMNRYGRTHTVQDGVVKYRDNSERIITTQWENVEKYMTKKRQWRPPRFMPRWVSRINLEIKDIKVERVQDITRTDIRKEGLDCPLKYRDDDLEYNYKQWYRDEWIKLWDSINKKKSYGWESNPWVWVISFKGLEV